MLSIRDQGKSGHLGVVGDRGETEFDAARGKRVNDFADIVADNAEAGSVRIVLDDATEGGLSIISHGVGLVKHDDLDGWDFSAGWVLGKFLLRKFLNFVSNHLNPPLIRSIQLKYSLPVEINSEHILCQCEYN